MPNLYRAMKAEGGLPVKVSTAAGLGVREGYDIKPDLEGNVHPGIGGLSVTPDDPDLMVSSLKPRALGGEGKNPLWSINSDDLAEELVYRHDERRQDRSHGFIEPFRTMTYADYAVAIAATCDLWERVAL